MTELGASWEREPSFMADRKDPHGPWDPKDSSVFFFYSLRLSFFNSALASDSQLDLPPPFAIPCLFVLVGRM